METPTAAFPVRSIRFARCAATFGAAAFLLASCVTSRTPPVPERVSDFDHVVALAAELAGRPYAAPTPRIPAPVRELDYDQYRMIPFLAHKALWRDTGLPFEISFYHPGYLYNDPVDVYTIEDGGTRRQAFDAERFGYYLDGGAARWSAGVDHYAGFVAMYPFDDGPWRECASFLGATYFRAIGSGHVYGSSARALAVDIGSPREEVFPRFSKFWIRKPQNGDGSLTVFALADSPPLAAAYRFDIAPGAETAVDVRAEIRARTTVGRVALAPITSMFWHRPGDERNSADFRPRVHDSEGLLVHGENGEWIWRPTDNPPSTRATTIGGASKGFGLLQRHRRAADFLDEEALYHRRPSVWVEPKSGFGAGAVELLELHADHEGVDNLAAYWAMDAPMAPGERRSAEWRVVFGDADPPEHRGARTTGFMIRPQGEEGRERRVRVAFRGGALDADPPVEELRAEFSASNGEVVGGPTIERLEKGVYSIDGTVRATGSGPMDLRALLRVGGDAATETWTWREDGN